MGALAARILPLGGELLRYVAVSGLGLAVDVMILVGLTEIGHVPYLVSAAIGFAAGAVLVYVLSIGWVFGARRYRDKPANEFLMFVAIGLAGLMINQTILYVGTEMLGAHYTASKTIAVGFVFSWNFGVRKALLFSREARA